MQGLRQFAKKKGSTPINEAWEGMFTVRLENFISQRTTLYDKALIKIAEEKRHDYSK